MDDKAYVWFVDPHTESDGRYNNVHLFHQEAVLVGTSGTGIHSRMIRSCFDTVDTKHFCQFFHFLPAQTVDDTGFPFMVFNKLNNVFRDISLFRTYFVV